MEIEAIKKVYRRYAKFYNLYFGAVFQPGRKAVVEHMDCRPGQRVLEVGVGTGLSLPLYPENVYVEGIDISAEMLERAQGRLDRYHQKHSVDLQVMDAEHMSFADSTFDKVVAMYVVSVVPHPAQLVNEMRRVCKPEGEILIVNHFHSPNPLVGGVETMLAPLSRLMGFHPDFCLYSFIGDTQLDVIDKHRVNLFGYWSLLRARNNKNFLGQGTCSATA